jgi:uncharacterized cupin superfamily protein
MVGNKKSIIRLSAHPEGFGETPDKLDANEFLSDVPVQHSHSVYEDDEIGLYVGVWDTEAMTEAGGPYACDEFMWVIEGECQIRNNRTGEIEPVKSGTPFVIPKGYDCQWQQSGYLRKYYVISEHPEEDIPAVPAHEGIVILKADQQNIGYEDTAGRFSSSIWTSEAYESGQHPFPHNEFAYVQDGSITFTDAEGVAHVFNAGDAFFVPEGVVCSAAVANNVLMYITIIKSN